MSPPAEEKMEDGKPLTASANSSPVDGEHGDTADSRFSDFCKVLVILF